MKKILESKLFRCSLFLIFIGVVCVFLENSFYQYVDENGVLHESFFVPLAAVSLLLGIIGICITALRSVYLLFNKK